MVTNSQPGILRIGLTGGIASGKTAVSDLFAELGATVIDTDIIAREVTEPGQAGLAQIVAHFGSDVLRADGTLNRAELRQRIFTDPAQRKYLDAMLHPLIKDATMARAAATAGNSVYQILVIPLLTETGFTELVDRVLVVDCPPENQRARLVARDHETPDSAAAMINAQASRETRLAIADDIINNEADLVALKEAVTALHHHYLELIDNTQ
jgi:dephospho-CoA kinase